MLHVYKKHEDPVTKYWNMALPVYYYQELYSTLHKWSYEKSAGNTVHDDVKVRVIATQLKVRDCQKRYVFIFSVFAYAPVRDGDQGKSDSFL